MNVLKHMPAKKPPALLLTPLLDMFTIILIFLIVSFEAEDYEFKPDPALELPQSSSRSIFKPAVNVAISPVAVRVDGNEIAPLEEGRAEEAHYESGEIPALVAVLEATYRRRFGELAERGEEPVEGYEEEGEEPVILVQADKRLDYRTLYLVLRSAAQAGFFKYRLVVLKR